MMMMMMMMIIIIIFNCERYRSVVKPAAEDPDLYRVI